MENQKIGSLLNMSIEVSEEQREKSPELSSGFSKEDKTFEIVLKYGGNLKKIEADMGTEFVKLYSQYAVGRMTEAMIRQLALHPQCEYIEKPKALLYEDLAGNQTSCISSVKKTDSGLTGKGVLIAVIDSGIDLFHPDFIREDGTSRIAGLWDQTAKGRPPEGYREGIYYEKEELDRAVFLGREEGRKIVSETDPSGHGTHVAGIAAGNGRASGGRVKGAAEEAELFIVKLGNPKEGDFPRTTQLMTGVDLSVRYALEHQMPLVVNLSFGNNYGAHNGTSLMETYLDRISGIGRFTMVAGTGNQGMAGRHTEGFLTEDTVIPFLTGPSETGFHLQIWKNYADEYSLMLIHPDGKRIGPVKQETGLSEFREGETEILCHFGEPSPHSADQEIYLSFLPADTYVDEGRWEIILLPEKIVTGFYTMWLPDSGLTSTVTGFLYPETDTTLTIPSTASKLISVGAYDPYTESMAPFSGRGYTMEKRVKPDLTAPGVNILSCAPGGGYVYKSGTSMAAPFVSGSAALMMEWGIIRGNDPFLYGEKVKAYLRKGAEPLPGFTVYPNSRTGYGRLCLSNSFPKNKKE